MKLSWRIFMKRRKGSHNLVTAYAPEIICWDDCGDKNTHTKHSGNQHQIYREMTGILRRLT